MARQPRVRITPTPSPTLPEEEFEQEDTVTEEAFVRRPPQHTATTDARPEPRADQRPAKRTRRRQSGLNEDIFYIPTEEIPEGSSYEWKRFSNVGEEDPFYIARMRTMGWEPVDPKNHPNWVPPGYKEPHIIKGGQILMERPMELTIEAREESKALARRQVIEAEQRLGMTPKDTLTRRHPGAAPVVTKEVGRMVPTVED